MKYYKIENGFLFEIDLNEKQIKEYQKKYFYYNKDEMIIFNFDYNKIKPLVLSIMQKKWYIKNLVKALTISFVWVIIFFMILFYLFNRNIENKITLIITKMNNEKQTKNKIVVSNPVGLSNIHSLTWSNNILTWTKKK